MSGDHFSGGKLPHEPQPFLDDELYAQVERNVVYSCTDVLLRDETTGKLFLANRQIDPQKGPWMVGGRDAYGSGPAQNAATQIRQDLGMQFDPSRFHHIASYSTEFPIAGPDREDHGRHTVSAVMMADLTPKEVDALNRRMAKGEIRDEYSDSGWYTIAEIADPKSDFPYLIKQLVRDVKAYDRGRIAMLEEALMDNELYDDTIDKERLDHDAEQLVNFLSLSFGLTHDEAKTLQHNAGNDPAYAVVWAMEASESIEGGPHALMTELAKILPDKELGDVQIMKQLADLGLTKPQVLSENGPALRSILKTAALTLAYNEQYHGELFTRVKAFKALAESAIRKSAEKN